MKAEETTIHSNNVDHQLINYLLLIGGSFGLLTFITSIITEGPVWPYRVVQISSLLLATALYILRQRVTLRFKVNFVSVLLMLVVVNGLIKSGPKASVSLLMILIALITLLAYEKRQAMAIYGGAILCYVAFGLVSPHLPIPQSPQPTGIWLAHALLLTMVGTVIQLYISTYIKSLKDLLAHLGEKIEDLQAHRKELEDTKNLLESAIAHSPSGIMIADADSVKISLANNAAFFIHGEKSQILTGIDPKTYTEEWEVLHTDFQPYLPTELPLYRALVNGEFIYSEEAIIKRPKEQKEHWISANAAPIINAEGKITSAIVLFHDITEIKRAQLNLEKLVAERTEKLQMSNAELNDQKSKLEKSIRELKETQSQLVRSEKMASLGTLVAGVGHEINNPLNFVKGGVLGISQFIDDHEVNDEQLQEIKPFIDSIEEGVSRASKIVKSLAHVSRQNNAFNEKCHIHDILDNCLLMLHNKMKDRVKVIKKYLTQEIVVMGNEGKLHQVFMNILSNAEQAIENDGFVTIETRIQNAIAEIKISDSGKGIAKGDMKKIGDPFFTTKEPGTGVGLGLYIVHTILEEHHGDWHVDSEKQRGSTFIIKLPIRPNPFREAMN